MMQETLTFIKKFAFTFLFLIVVGLLFPTSISAESDLPACPESWEPNCVQQNPDITNTPGFLQCSMNNVAVICCPSSLGMVIVQTSVGVGCGCPDGDELRLVTTGDTSEVRCVPTEDPQEDPNTQGGILGRDPSNPSDNTTGYEVNSDTLDALNPLVKFGNTATTGPLNTPGAVISRFLTMFAYPIAGLILFVMLIWGGFEILSGAASKKSMDAGKQRIQSALLGFFLLFISYWIVQLIEFVFGVQIL